MPDENQNLEQQEIDAPPPDAMGGEESQNDTESFDDFAKRMGDPGGSMPEFGFTTNTDDKVDPKKKEPESKEDEGTEDDANATDEGEEKEKVDAKDWVKKRIDRERKKVAARDAENERLKKELADLKSQQSQQQETKTEDTQDDQKDELDAASQKEIDKMLEELGEEPKSEDYDEEDDWINALADYYDALDEIEDRREGVRNETETDEQETAQTEQTEQEAQQEQQADVNQQEQPRQYTAWDDMFEIVEESEVENLASDLYQGLSQGQIHMTEGMLNFMIDNEEHAAAIAEKFVENPRVSRRIAREIGSRQEVALKKLVEPEKKPAAKRERKPSPADMSDLKGQKASPQKPIDGDIDFAEFEGRMEESNKGFTNPFDFL